MPLIENRKFLNWSAAYFVAVAAVAVSSTHLDFPFNGDELRSSVIYGVLVVPAALVVFAVMISALMHILRYKRFVWILLMIFTAYLGAYLYGYIVASNPEFNDRE